MTTNLPPQAYTRETLVKAIDWLSGQPPSVRARANSADLVVSHYLQARRREAARMEAPVSGENFKTDLISLAEDLRKFEEIHPHSPAAHPEHTTPLPSAAAQTSRTPFGSFEDFLPEPLVTRKESAYRTPEPKGVTWQVDPRSLAIVREVQARFNLSQESEAIRLLIIQGHDRIQKLFL